MGATAFTVIWYVFLHPFHGSAVARKTDTGGAGNNVACFMRRSGLCAHGKAMGVVETGTTVRDHPVPFGARAVRFRLGFLKRAQRNSPYELVLLAS